MDRQPSPGLRERKKAETRRAISDVATGMFMERGFDAVTVAEIAEAANVSVKTVFNHFGSKEELFLDREEEVQRHLVRAVADAGPEGVAASLATVLADRRIPDEPDWSRLHAPEGYAGFRRFLACWAGAPTVRARHLLLNERLREEMAPALAARLGLDPAAPRVAVMAAMIVAAVELRFHVLIDAVRGGAPAAEAEARVRAVVAEATGRLSAAFPELAGPPTTPAPRPTNGAPAR